VAADCSKRFGSISNPEARANSTAPHHSELVSVETAVGLADGPNDFCFDVGLSANEIEHFTAVVAQSASH